MIERFSITKEPAEIPEKPEVLNLECLPAAMPSAEVRSFEHRDHVMLKSGVKVVQAFERDEKPRGDVTTGDPDEIDELLSGDGEPGIQLSAVGLRLGPLP